MKKILTLIIAIITLQSCSVCFTPYPGNHYLYYHDTSHFYDPHYDYTKEDMFWLKKDTIK